MPAPPPSRAPADEPGGFPAGLDAPLALRALEASGTGVCIVDARRPRLPLVWANDSFTKSEIDLAQLADLLADLREGNARQITLHHRRGSQGSASQVSFSPMRDRSGELTHLIGVQQPVIDGVGRPTASALANHDPLTGLPNRTVLMDRIAQALVRIGRRGGTVGVMFLDFDAFKHVNDRFGHDAGDAFLADVPARLATAVRIEDTVARLGGDKFVVLCQDVGGEAGAAAVARRVLRAFEEPFAVGEERVAVRASVGVALADSSEETADLLLANADLAMYRAKRAGGDGFEIFDCSLRERVNERVGLARDLRAAIGTDALSLHYQPIVDLGTQRVVSVEALLRWDHPERGPIGPSEFVPLAEETGIIVELGRWVLDRACTEFSEALHDADDRRIELAVNISPRQLADAGLPAALEQIMRRTGLRPGRLALEITETALTQESDAPAERLWALKQLGTRIVLDDFGSGFSSLGHLRRFPIDTIKIDRSFIAGLGTQSRDAAIVGAILPMARALDLEVVAEGVETEAKLAHLYALGCRQGQGFLFARPAPMGQIVDLVAAAGSTHAQRRTHPGLRLLQSRFKAALAAGDTEQAGTVIRAAIGDGFDGLDIQAQVIGPALHYIGDEWALGRLAVADEHLATAIAGRSLGMVFESMSAGGSQRRGRIVLAAVEGEHHVLGLRMTSDALHAAGYEVIYLGADVPDQSLLTAVERHCPDAVCLTATVPAVGRTLVNLTRRLRSRHPEMSVIVGGPAVPAAAASRSGGLVAESVEQAVELVRVGSAGAEPGTELGPSGLAAAG